MAETNIPPALQLKSLLASYPNLDEMNPSSWFVWSENPDYPPKLWDSLICHADMRYTHAGYDYLVTAVPKNDNVSLSYLRMLIHGPFKSVSDLIFLTKVKDQHYLMCSNLERWPAPVLFNFCIASRVPTEFPDKLDGWKKLVSEGYPEVLAFCMSHSTGGKPFKDKRYFPEHGHDWFDPSSDWNRIIEGTPDLTAKDYKSSPGSITPCNVIWGKSHAYELIAKLDDIKTAEFFGFKHPPKKEPRKLKADFDTKVYENVAWQIAPQHGHMAPAPVGLAGAAINQLNQIHPQQQGGAWAQVAQAIHDEAAQVAQAPQPFVDHIDDFVDEFPDFPEDNDD